MPPNLRRRRSSSAATPEQNTPATLDRPPPASPLVSHVNSPDALPTPTAGTPPAAESLFLDSITTGPRGGEPDPAAAHSSAVSSGVYESASETAPETAPETTAAAALETARETAPESAPEGSAQATGPAAAPETASAPEQAGPSQPPGAAPEADRLGASVPDRSALNLLDQLLDTVTGARPPDTAAAPAAGPGPVPANVNIINDAGDGAGAAGASISTTGATPDNAGAIVITVNYMFLDTGNDPSPGRTGSLVVTLPNNATNREPRIISQFISLATRMAYSTLLNGPKPKPGVTLEKFQSFKALDVGQLQDTTCPVCFESYDPLVEPILGSKRRKLTPESHCVSGNATPERDAEPSQSAEPAHPAPTSAEGADAPQPEKAYLCDDTTDYGHVPVQLPCGHVFGQGCLAQWLKEHTTCPLCRLSVAEPEQQQPSQRVAPISYIRFGGLGDALNGQDPPPQNSEEGSPGSTTPLGHDTNIPGLLRRATQAIFNNTQRRDPPAPPFEADGYREPSQSRNPSFAPVINNIQNYFRRSRRQREQDTTGATSLFTTGVSSRRTENGVETFNSDSPSASSFFDQLRFMSDDLREWMASSENREGQPGQTEQNQPPQAPRGNDRSNANEARGQSSSARSPSEQTPRDPAESRGQDSERND